MFLLRFYYEGMIQVKVSNIQVDESKLLIKEKNNNK